MGNLNAGDLALVIKASCEENVGRVVKLLDSRLGDIIELGDRRALNRLGGECWIVEGELVSRNFIGETRRDGLGVFPAAWLMPLRGDFQPEQQREQELQPCL